MARVVVVGAINMDVVAAASRHPEPGETVLGTSLALFPGGKGANQAVAAARAGAPVHMVGWAGSDDFGERMLEFLVEAGVDVSDVRRTDRSTGSAVVVVNPIGENSVVSIPGANAMLSRVDVLGLDFAPGDVVLAQLETAPEATAVLFERAREAGATTILNASPAPGCPEELLDLARILVVNELELGQLGRGTKVNPKLTPGQTLVVTLGPDGAVAFRGHEDFRTDPPADVEPLDTTGAGDCFAGSLAARLSFGDDLESALRYATVAASISVERPGAGPSMPDAREVDERTRR